MSRQYANDQRDELGDLSVASSSGRTPRSKKTRTRDGCLTCRKCKKACDKTKPACLRCQRLSYACEWPKIKPYSHVGADGGSSKQRSESQDEQHAESEQREALQTTSTVMPPYSFSASSSATASPVVPSALYFPTAGNNTPNPSELSFPKPSSTAPDLHTGQPFHNGFHDVSNPSAESPPSNALDAHFWQDHSLYAFDYNFTDFSDIDSLLRLAGLAPMQDTASGVNAGESSTMGTTVASNTGSSQIVLPKDKIKAISRMFSPRVVALLDRMIQEQDGSSQVKLPLAYIVSMCLWAPTSAMKDLLQAAKDAYSGPGMHSMLNDLGDVAWSFLLNTPAKATKIAISPERIATMDISLSSKLFALMDIAFRQAVVEGAAAYYAVADVMEKLLLKSFKPGHLFNVAEIGRTETVYLYNFVYVDIMRAIQLGLPTTFAYHYAPLPGPKPDVIFSVGNSDSILCIMSEICALRFLLDQDVNSRTNNGLNPIYQPKADEILKKIEANPAFPLEEDVFDSEEGLDSVQHVAGIAAQEAWRQAALIHYYHSIYRGTSTFEKASQAACHQILKLFPVTQMGKPHRLFGLHGLPVFMAATVANTKEDRESCIEAFDTLSLCCAADKEIKFFFTGVWDASDKAGHQLDWLQFASTEKGPVYM